MALRRFPPLSIDQLADQRDVVQRYALQHPVNLCYMHTNQNSVLLCPDLQDDHASQLCWMAKHMTSRRQPCWQDTPWFMSSCRHLPFLAQYPSVCCPERYLALCEAFCL